MAGKVTMGFEPGSVTVAIADILPLTPVDDTVRKTRKFQQISASIREIGVRLPPIVARRRGLKGKYLLLDGHARIDVLKDMGVAEATCLVSLDDEALTYNREVNPLTPVQEHRMILEVIARGVSEQRIAQALNVNIASIRTRRDLLNGICPEVAALLKDKACPFNTFQALKKVKPLRQHEIAMTMIGVDNFSVAYARTLVATSAPDQLVKPGKPGSRRRVSPEEMAQIERELANLREEVERIEETFAADHLNLVLAASYIRSLLRNAGVDRYLRTYRGELRERFREICEETALEAAD